MPLKSRIFYPNYVVKCSDVLLKGAKEKVNNIRLAEIIQINH